MASYARLRDRLPSLYRPDDEPAEDLLVRYLRTVGARLDAIELATTDLMRAHWFGFADRGHLDPWLVLRRQEEQPPPATTDPEVIAFPYIQDLARLAALLDILPWREPLTERETVEAYRQRIRRVVALYRNGLGTVQALRAMVEAQLPLLDALAPPGLRDRPFSIEEFAPLITRVHMVRARGAPQDRVGPLMRWTVQNEGLAAIAPSLYIQGIPPEPGDPETARPVIERYLGGSRGGHLGIAYDGSLAPGQTLRLRPAYQSWLASAAGLRRAESLPSGEDGADPSAAGPWQPVADAPSGTLTVIAQASDSTLWLAAEEAGTAALWRFDGATWSEALSGLPPVRTMILDGRDLLAATAGGLVRLDLYPEGGGPPAATPDPAALAGPAVSVILRTVDGQLWTGGENGLARIQPDGTAAPFVLGADAETAVAVHVLFEDRDGTLFVGTDRTVFCWQPFADAWYWYEGRERSDEQSDWQAFSPQASGAERNFPGEDAAFLPTVRSIRRGRDAALWLGTDRGIARYIARPVEGLAYTTLLEAFPHLTTAPVWRIDEGPDGDLWFATEDGLFRYDGRDWWRLQGDALARLSLPEDASKALAWRFDRSADAWQRFDARAGWTSVTPSPTPAEDAVRAVLWTDGVVAELGSFDGTTFTVDRSATPAGLRMRYKPSEGRIVDGGLVAVPRLPAGSSIWRYLALEEDPPAESSARPAWTIEGRLLPPPSAREAPEPGRFGAEPAPALSPFDDAVFAYRPAARVWFALAPRQPLTVLARLARVEPEEKLDPAVLDRVWRGIEQVRPAGVRALLAVGREMVRGR